MCLITQEKKWEAQLKKDIKNLQQKKFIGFQ